MPVSWPRNEIISNKEREFYETLEINEDYPCASAPLPVLANPFHSSKTYLRSISEANSVPKNYCYGSNETFPLPVFSKRMKSKKLSKKFDEVFPCEDTETSSSESLSSFQKLFLPPPVRRNQSFAGFVQVFPTIPSVEFDTYDPDTYKGLRKWSSVGFTSDFSETRGSECQESFLKDDSEKPMIIRTHSLIAEDKIIDVEYDSDVGWKTTKVRDILTKKKPENEEKVNTERRYSRDSLKLDLNSDNKSSQRRKSLENSKFSPSVDQNETENSKGKIEGSPKVNEKSPKNVENLFEKCRSTVSSFSNEISDEEGADDVFDSLSNSRDKLSDHKETPAPKSLKQKLKKRSTSCENLSKKSLDSKSRSSSVSINETPEYFDANVPLKSAFPSLNAKPKRGSLKNSPAKNSDYDRDRGRSRHTDGHRESFKKNERTNERGSQDASDREHKDGSLNRSLSNNDTNLEDRIGLYGGLIC